MMMKEGGREFNCSEISNNVLHSRLHKILWVAVSSTVGLRVERRHHLQSVCLQDVVLMDQTNESHLVLSLVCKVHDDIQHEVLLWMGQQPKEFYAVGIGALMKRWDKCINIGGDYVEK
ncbi:hypothetical protein AVEN_113281-1 [Araneus ventricosus]|uniref:Uncharacterized protein n=1 Tax=Araneus ventricosus TaxID=182803 RepID=A0A4Y2N2Y5_ARAVE|nr:hypothetical protein AVEN_113281-1 [Araneus ventricosus]